MMKSLFSKIALVCLPLGLVGCSSSVNLTEKNIDESLVTQNGRTIRVSYMINDPSFGIQNKFAKIEKLRVIERGHNASAVAGDVTKTIFCNPLSLFNLIGACKADIYTHSREDLEGDQTEIDNVSKTYAYPKYKELLTQKLSLENYQNYSKIPIYFIPDENYLVYDENGYKLYTGFKIYVKYSRIDSMFECKENTLLTKEKAKVNNYQIAVEESKKLLDRCFQRLGEEHFKTITNQLEDERKQFL